MDINYDGTLLLTAGKDKFIKLWDLRSDKLIYTFKGHRNYINGIKFKLNSNEFCSVSADRTFKLWDATEKAYIDT